MPEKQLSNTPSLLVDELEGTIERITYQNEENGYTIARLRRLSEPGEVTVVGNLPGIVVGQMVKLTGTWVNHQQYGRQFEIEGFTFSQPVTPEGLKKFLGSGLIKGIGPVTASNIVEKFGLDSLEIIENEPHRLTRIAGIGEKKAAVIHAAWQDQKQIKEIMIFFQGQGISPFLAAKIYRQYGDKAVEIIRRNPYQLARDIQGIGFKTADDIAQKAGIARNDPYRVQAGILYTLGQLAEDGHCYAEKKQLISETSKILAIAADEIEKQINAIQQDKDIIIDQQAVYLAPYYYAEQIIAQKIASILSSRMDRLSIFDNKSNTKLIAALDRFSPHPLTGNQKDAILLALREKISILTGGPGTGKSTITGGLVQILRANGKSILLAAPTGRAARRLSQTTGMEAKTIHRLLEFSPSYEGGFGRNEHNPLDADMIIIDESSMIDLLLFQHLISALQPGSHLLLVGDVDQLPSVGAGNVLRDLIESGIIPVTRLTEIFRQAEASHIITNAHRINQGQMPEFSRDIDDFFLFVENDSQKAADWVIELVKNRIPARFGYDPINDIQVLTPIHRGPAGVAELNQRLQSALNPPAAVKAEFQQGSRYLRLGDRVMQIRNNYDRMVFNGDLGIIRAVDPEDQTTAIDFDGRLITYDFSDLNEITHAYAISIHKSQGCEFPVVVVPIITSHYIMLQRNLLYTAVTRAKNLVVLVGSQRAIAMAVKNNRIVQRNTLLKKRLLHWYKDPTGN